MFPVNWDAVVAIIAVLALVQPWLFAAYRHFLQRGSIEMYETGDIEIGFAAAGTLISLQGTLRAVHRDQFVKSMQIEVVRERDHARSLFEWTAFKPISIGDAKATFQLTAGFMLLSSAPRRYNVLFVDRVLQDEIRTRLDNLRRVWNERFTAVVDAEMLRRAGAGDRAAADQVEALRQQFYDGAFNQERIVNDTFGELQRVCWVAGRYNITLRVNTNGPDQSFTRSWNLDLSEQESQNLRLNILAIMRSAANLPPTGYGHHT
jgi:hypothetical protein